MRSSLAEVRNPALALPGIRALQRLDSDQRVLIGALLRDLGNDAAARADKCWRTHKAPMAAYWKAVSVYARHIARAIERGADATQATGAQTFTENGNGDKT